MSAQTQPSPAPAAVLDRVIAASVDRIWENVLDWEHLPYLHAQAFSGVRPLAAGSDGWRALIDLPGTAGITEVEVTLQRGDLRYVTATVGGFGEGSQIVTTLAPQGEQATRIRVEFVLPWAPAQAAAKIGEAYRAMYQVLWDQDEAMMGRRQRLLDGAFAATTSVPARLAMGEIASLRGRLPIDVDVGSRRVRILELDGELRAVDLLCPHQGGQLESAAEHPCELVCPWHGYRFDVRTGASCDGRSLRLFVSPRVEIDADGRVFLLAPRRAA